MNTTLANRSQISNYGGFKRLRFSVANKAIAKYHGELNRYKYIGKAASQAQRNEYIIDGITYPLVTSLKEFDVVLCPDRTYGKVERRTNKFLGAY